jgi:hypothetical protein
MFSYREMATRALPDVPTAVPNAAEAVARHGSFGQLWLDALWRGDPLADAVVGDGAPLVRRALADGIDAVEEPPPALVDFFAEVDAPPAWLDRDRCDRASLSLARQTREYGLVLGAASLVAGAQNSLAARPLAFTGRYARDAATRSLEVGAWLSEVTTPGGLERHSLGFERTVRVRMIHAHVRAHLGKSPKWDLEAWGLPIPQPHMAFTLAEFCSIALRAMAQLGVRYTDTELEDIHHLWRCVGRLVGVEEALLPRDPDDYARIEDLYALTSPGPDDADRAFVTALTDFQAAELGRFLPRRARPTGLMHGLQRAFVGDRVADQLRIPDTRWRHLPRLVGPLTAAGNATHDALVPDGKARRTRRALRKRDAEMTRMRKKYGVDHDLVDAAR